MKKRITLIAVAAATLALAASCDTKACYCNDYTADGAVPNTVYTDVSSPCSSLNRGTGGEYGSRVCVEADEPRPYPGAVASKKKRK
ncbi:MAG: hypothetical protein K5650_08355 [Bacteroidales bacterium]|nr:hypothetical protein [Bacteroidales bacterium]